jgi:hypothetical protein
VSVPASLLVKEFALPMMGVGEEECMHKGRY